MKFFILIVCACLIIASVQCLTEEQKNKVKGYFKDCLAATGANAEAIQKSRQGEFVDDPKVAEFVFCFFKKVGFMNESGDLQETVIKAKISGDLTAEEIKTVIGKCNGQTGKDNNEKAYNIYKCYWNSTPNHISLTS
ncbi:B2 protein-like [Onthophagus taurus]|uniref:B2 protein-like n=1 Tax=Onthophagus taurus TaxID=166361 RepID=UPI000C200D65|nr:uncharacterized protein LOC111423886 [Onthophagus taurus]XP_022913172.1 uncharacterized protein LOC111423980 [Onthophagus taurus]